MAETHELPAPIDVKIPGPLLAGPGRMSLITRVPAAVPSLIIGS